ncbi:MAG: glycosyltransferase, exosortase A system-associated [Kiloniellaceae bacterium]
MRILHVLDHSLPQQSGYVFRTLGILRAQRARGWQTFHLTTPRHPDTTSAEETVDGWHFYRTPLAAHPSDRLPFVRDWRQMQATRARLDGIIRELRPDILHAHSPVLNGLPALGAARRHGIPLVYEIRAFCEDAAVDLHKVRAWGARYRATRALETYLLRRADAAVTICEGLRNDIVDRGIPAGKVTVVPNAVDMDDFREVPPRDAALAGRYGLTEGATIGFIGSFYAYEGLELLIEAAARLKDRIPELKLLMVGGGPQQDNLRALAQSLGLDGRAIFTGRVPHEDVKRYYGLVDVLVYPRHRMRLTDLVTPLKPLEAMAQGKLVLASDVGGHRELIEPGATGFLFPADDTAGLVQALVDLFDRRQQWPAVRARGRRLVEEERSWAASAARYAPVYAALSGQ